MVYDFKSVVQVQLHKSWDCEEITCFQIRYMFGDTIKEESEVRTCPVVFRNTAVYLRPSKAQHLPSFPAESLIVQKRAWRWVEAKCQTRYIKCAHYVLEVPFLPWFPHSFSSECTQEAAAPNPWATTLNKILQYDKISSDNLPIPEFLLPPPSGLSKPGF